MHFDIDGWTVVELPTVWTLMPSPTDPAVRQRLSDDEEQLPADLQLTADAAFATILDEEPVPQDMRRVGLIPGTSLQGTGGLVVPARALFGAPRMARSS